jgi:hypothetical protein
MFGTSVPPGAFGLRSIAYRPSGAAVRNTVEASEW